jgi:hypothetical protein
MGRCIVCCSVYWPGHPGSSAAGAILDNLSGSRLRAQLLSCSLQPHAIRSTPSLNHPFHGRSQDRRRLFIVRDYQSVDCDLHHTDDLPLVSMRRPFYSRVPAPTINRIRVTAPEGLAWSTASRAADLHAMVPSYPPYQTPNTPQRIRIGQ